MNEAGVTCIPKAFYRVNDLADILGISKTSAHALVKDGRIRFARLDGCVLIPREEVQRMVAEIGLKVGRWPNP